jgi:hypothetical protein
LKTNAKHKSTSRGNMKDDNKQIVKRARNDVELFMDKFLNSTKIIRRDIGKKVSVTITNH